jgi:hypothetical protein
LYIGCAIGHNSEGGKHKEHANQISLIWFNVFKGENLNVKVYNVQWTTERQTPSDDKSSSNLWPGELKTKL